MNSGRNHTQFVPWWQFHCTDQRHHASCSSDSWTSESNVQVDVSAYLHLSSISSCYPPVLVMFSGHWRGHVRHVTSECLMVSPWNRGSSACLPSSNNARSNWKNSPHHTEMTTWVRIGLKFKKNTESNLCLDWPHFWKKQMSTKWFLVRVSLKQTLSSI
jgi:hypothetical protein